VLVQELLTFGIHTYPPCIVNQFLRTWLPLLYRHGVAPERSHFEFLATYDAPSFKGRWVSDYDHRLDTSRYGDTTTWGARDANEYTIDTAAFIALANLVLVRAADPWTLAPGLTAAAARIGCGDKMKLLLDAIRVCEKEYSAVIAQVGRDAATGLASKLGHFVDRLV
jgi:hypothetical protein